MTSPTEPIAFDRPAAALEEVLETDRVAVPEALLSRLGEEGIECSTDPDALARSSRDWWPFALRWALAGKVPARPSAVVRPRTSAEVATVLGLADEARIPVTASAGRSGVCGGAVPVFGGLALDCCGLSGLTGVDETSLVVKVRAGTFGPDLERELAGDHGLTVGHFPQSFDLATVGGWLACRGAGQYSTRYGKIEDIVAGLEVVLADGRTVRTGYLAGAGPRAATGPDLTQLFVGSEGTLGVITEAALRAHPRPAAEWRSAFRFARFADGLDALRRTMAAGATPAVVRLYDERESTRHFEGAEGCVLVVLDEGVEELVGATATILGRACRQAGGEPLDEALVSQWLDRRNDVSALESVTRAGLVVDTIEVAADWSELEELYDDGVEALAAIDGCLAASAHESHAYLDGACLYFTFAGRGQDPADDEWARRYYEASWSSLMAVTRRHRGSISHHHGIGLVRGPYLRDALGEGFGLLEKLKAALDPHGILNPGKLGLGSPFGPAPRLVP